MFKPASTQKKQKTPTSTHQIPNQPKEKIVSGIDNATLILVPAGDFMMGNERGEENGYSIDEYPAHQVSLNAFYIDQYEVTNAQYQLCAKSGACNPPQSVKSQKNSVYFGNPKFAQYPVIKVSWEDANSYCKWAERRLPTEAEWEKAARWDPVTGLSHQYPWGESLPNETLANFGLNVGDTSRVGAYENGRSPLNVYDLAGNVWEWVADWYQQDYYTVSPGVNPTGPTHGYYRVLRGGSWISSSFEIRAADRFKYAPQGSRFDAGFRCAKDVTP